MLSISFNKCVVTWFCRSIWSGISSWSLCLPQPSPHPLSPQSPLLVLVVSQSPPRGSFLGQLDLLQRYCRSSWRSSQRSRSACAVSTFRLPQRGPRSSRRSSSAFLSWWSLGGWMHVSPHVVGRLLALPAGHVSGGHGGSQLSVDPWASTYWPFLCHQCCQILETLLFYLNPCELLIFPYVIHIVMCWISGRFLPKGKGTFLKVTGESTL